MVANCPSFPRRLAGSISHASIFLPCYVDPMRISKWIFVKQIFFFFAGEGRDFTGSSDGCGFHDAWLGGVFLVTEFFLFFSILVLDGDRRGSAVGLKLILDESDRFFFTFFFFSVPAMFREEQLVGDCLLIDCFVRLRALHGEGWEQRQTDRLRPKE